MRAILMMTACAALAACSSGEDLFTSPVDARAGSQLNDGTFGQATMDNHLAMTGQYRTNLNNRFNAEVPTMVTFPFNSTALSSEARTALRAQAQWINQFPEVKFRVYGHTDLVGGTAYNRRLGLRRAQAVVLYLVSQGVDRKRLDAVVSLGETQPLIVTQGREQRNRRTVTEVRGFDRRHPNIMNGKYAAVIFREYVESGTYESRLNKTETDLTVPEG